MNLKNEVNVFSSESHKLFTCTNKLCGKVNNLIEKPKGKLRRKIRK